MALLLKDGVRAQQANRNVWQALTTVNAYLDGTYSTWVLISSTSPFLQQGLLSKV